LIIPPTPEAKQSHLQKEGWSHGRSHLCGVIHIHHGFLILVGENFTLPKRGWQRVIMV
jgi:hypothetical protein